MLCVQRRAGLTRGGALGSGPARRGDAEAEELRAKAHRAGGRGSIRSVCSRAAGRRAAREHAQAACACPFSRCGSGGRCEWRASGEPGACEVAQPRALRIELEGVDGEEPWAIQRLVGAGVKGRRRLRTSRPLAGCGSSCTARGAVEISTELQVGLTQKRRSR